MPKLQSLDKEYLDAYYRLSARRTSSLGGPNPISIESIVAYMAAVEVDSVTERLKYMDLIQTMDDAFMSYWADKNNKKK